MKTAAKLLKVIINPLFWLMIPISIIIGGMFGVFFSAAFGTLTHSEFIAYFFLYMTPLVFLLTGAYLVLWRGN